MGRAKTLHGQHRHESVQHRTEGSLSGRKATGEGDLFGIKIEITDLDKDRTYVANGEADCKGRKAAMKMKLTDSDKALLIKWGFKKADLGQIEKATNKTEYIIDNEKITLTEVLDILNREDYLSGISRSAFHWSACRQNDKGQIIHFDSSNLFK